MKRWIFISMEAILYGVFLWIDMFVPRCANISIYVKYTSILLCFFYVLFCCDEDIDHQDQSLVQLILLFTLISDTFLLLIGNYALGMTTFLVAQLLHRYRLRKGRKQRTYRIALFGFFLLICLSLMGIALDYVLIVAVFYFLCMVTNAGYSLIHRENVIYTIGLILFLCCDINVGLFNIAAYIEIPEALSFFINHVVSVLMWLFYLPSQVLIALSVKPRTCQKGYK